MGWSSGGEIFNQVARSLIDGGASDGIKKYVLSELIAALRQGDWDTEDESLEEFSDDPAVVDAFRLNGVTLSGTASAAAVIDFDYDTDIKAGYTYRVVDSDGDGLDVEVSGLGSVIAVAFLHNEDAVARWVDE
jgi:hypothetical protein